MDKQEILRKEQEYYKEIREGISDIIHHELGRWIFIALAILLIWLGSWMAFRYLKDSASFDPSNEQKEGVNDGG